MSRPYRILFLSRSYPNTLFPELGLWVKRLVHHCTERCEITIISPVPYFPAVKGFETYTRFRKIPHHSTEDGVKVLHPRFFAGPGRSLYPTEALSYYFGIRNTTDRLHRHTTFDLIHAHFIYPDGVVGSWLGERYNIPVIVTEHAPWIPNWIDRQWLVRQQAVQASKKCASIIAVSTAVKHTIVHFTQQPEKVRIIPIGTDGSVFTTPHNGNSRNKKQILYVGFINFNKGIDILFKAIKRVTEKRPDTRLVLVGGGFYANTMKQEKRLHAMATEMGLDKQVQFAGIQSPQEVARYMRESALLVLPSRAESFGAVLVEALACGTPVVATRCGGPEDIVTDDVGILVPGENDEKLAHAIEQILAQQLTYNEQALRNYALTNFSWQHVAQKTIDLYRETVEK